MAGGLDRVLYALRLKKRPRLQRTRGEVLQSVPIRNSLVEWMKEDGGEVSLIIPADQKRHMRWLIRAMSLPNKRVVTLDDVGSFVWERCDGESTFEQIAQELSGRFQLTRREAEASLAEFFRVLGRRGMLGFAVPESRSTQSGADAKNRPGGGRKTSKGNRRKSKGRA